MGEALATRRDLVPVLEGLAARPVPILGTRAAAAHTARGYGYLCPDELAAVWAALDAWLAAGRPEPTPAARRAQSWDGRYKTWAALVTACTRFDIGCRREMGI